MMLFASACCIAIPLLAAWAKNRYWLWLEERGQGRS